MKKFITAGGLLIALFANAQKNKLIIGTYTSGKSEGIYIYDFDSKTGDSKFESSIKSSNPSFLAVSPDKKYLYAVNEDADSLNNGGMVSAYKFDRKRKQLSFINQQPSKGNHPCYVSVDKTNTWVIASNYSGGSFSILRKLPDGSLAAPKKAIQHDGKSLNKERQEKAHVHQALLSADNKNLLVADLGLDKVMVYDFNSYFGTTTITPGRITSVSAGSGPRHLAFHPSNKYVYLTEELSGTVAAFAYHGATGQLKLMQTISAVPEGYKGSLSGADIHVSPDGKFLYASNRGELNNLVIYKIDGATGVLSVIGFQPTLGIKPRNFSFDPTGNFLLVANQESGNISIFSVNHITGLLTDTGKSISVPNPVCLVWVK